MTLLELHKLCVDDSPFMGIFFFPPKLTLDSATKSSPDCYNCIEIL